MRVHHMALVACALAVHGCREGDSRRELEEREHTERAASEREAEGRGSRRAAEATVFSAEPAPLEDMRRGAEPFESARMPPAGVDRVVFESLTPDDNPPNEARIALGRKLFFEPRLSADGTITCATCHDPTRGFVDHRGTSEGIRDQIGRRNAPPVLNAALLGSQFWDGRAATLEDQAKLPIVNPIEMGHPDADSAVNAIAGDADYQRMFQEAYGRPPNMDDIGRAIASYERTLVAFDTPFDRFLRGDEDAMSEDARAGWVLFNEKARCVSCHIVSPSSPIFSDSAFHNIGVAARHQDFADLARRARQAIERDDSQQAIDELAINSDLSELGRFIVTRSIADMGAFRTPQLRNVAVTGPYMHDGSMATLWDVMDHYNKGGEANPFLDGGMEPLALEEREIDQLVAFMFALTSEPFADVARREHDRQRSVSRSRRPFRDEDLAMRRTLQFEPREADAPRPPAGDARGGG